MSIVFIMYGLLFIFIITKSIILNNYLARRLIILSLLFFLISYFSSSQTFDNMYFNSLQIFSLILLTIVLLIFRKFLYIQMFVLSLMLVFINLKFELNNYTFGVLDFEIVFKGLLILFLINSIFNISRKSYLNFGGKFYDKKIMLNIVDINYSFSNNYI